MVRCDTASAGFIVTDDIFYLNRVLLTQPRAEFGSQLVGSIEVNLISKPVLADLVSDKIIVKFKKTAT